MGGVFLDISKAFDKVWLKGIVFKLKQNEISGKLLSVLSDFLKDFGFSSFFGSYQQSRWWPITECKVVTDDTSLYSLIEKVDTFANELNNYLHQTNIRVFQWKMRFNPDPSKQTQEVIFSRKAKKISHPFLRFKHCLTITISKTLRHISWCLIDFWRKCESNHYQGKWNYRTDTKIAKCFVKTGINYYMQNFCDHI